MASFNKVILMGNLTADPTLRYTPNKAAVCNFTLAINRKYKSPDGTLKDDVCFVDCAAWNKVAENIQKFVGKGRPLFVEGRLTLNKWKDKETGKQRSKLTVTVDSFQFIDSSGAKATADAAAGNVPSQADYQPEDDSPPF
jgi:single-strand DNA-binding protein